MAEETRSAAVSPAPTAWLGVQLARPEASITAHLPDLPLGFGFLVTSVTPEGPAEEAGIRAFDVIWKFNDQMLVNEGQLAALLRLRSPGEQVNLSGFRQGKPANFSLELGTTPKSGSRLMARMIDSSLLPDGVESVPMRIVRVNAKVASYSTGQEQMDVSKSEDGYLVRVTGHDGGAIFEGKMAEDGSISGLSKDWMRRARALRRGLDHQLASPSGSELVRRGDSAAAPTSDRK